MKRRPREAVASGESQQTVRTPRGSLVLRIVAPLVVLGWLIGTGALLKYVPPLQPQGARAVLGAAIGKSSPVVKTAIQDAKRFDFPVASEVVIVQHRRHDLSPVALAHTLRETVALDLHQLPGLQRIGGAIPVARKGKLLSTATGHTSTVLTFLLFKPNVRYRQATLLAERYAHRYLSGPSNGFVGVTGAYPAEYLQGQQIDKSLATVEWLAIGILILVVGLTFRSIVAPLLTLLAAGIAFEFSQRLLSLATLHLGVQVPKELSPIIVVLLLGLMTDYSVFYLTAFRRGMRQGDARRVAAPLAAREITPIVFVAGLTVAAGVALIQIAHLSLFSVLGPGLAITVAVTFIVASTFIPSAMTLLGRYTLWPSKKPTPPPKVRRRFQNLICNPWFGGSLAVVAVGVLIWLTIPLGNFSVGIDLIGDLPHNSQPARAELAAGHSFAMGVVAPTEVLVTGGDSRNLGKLSKLQSLIAHQPGVAGVVGPGDKFSQVPHGVFVSKTSDAARYLVVLKSEPFGSKAIGEYDHLHQVMPSLLHRSGLSSSAAYYTGDTALSADIAHFATGDLYRVALAVMLVDFLLLALYLRALIAPLVLVLASALVVAAALGLTIWLFPSAGGAAGYTFYAPFAAEVLLLSFGTDYNLFLTGEIWSAARRQRFRRAIAQGGTVASAGINVAGATLALSFAVLLVVPLRSFTYLAVAIFVGLMLDTFVVRFFVVPGVLTLIGTRAGWPGHRLERASKREAPPAELVHPADWEPGSRSA